MNFAALNSFLDHANQKLHGAVEQLLRFASRPALSAKDEAKKELPRPPVKSGAPVQGGGAGGSVEPNQENDRRRYNPIDDASGAFITADAAAISDARAASVKDRVEEDPNIQRQNLAMAKANAELRAEIADRKKAEQTIREQNEFLKHVIESLPHPFYVLDARDFTIKMANSAAGEMTANTTCHALTHHRSLPCDGLEHQCPLQEVKKTKKPVIVEHIHFDLDGNPRNVEVHGYPIFDEHGEVVQMIEYSLDITERKRLEEELQNNAEKIKLFAYSISHDIKSPIIGVHGLVELLNKKYGAFLDETGKKYCEQIIKASRQVVALIEELNIFIRSKESRLNFELISVKEVLETIRNEFSPLLDLRKISWVEPETLPTVKADKLSLLRIFRNLVENALKYGGANLSEIRIGYQPSDTAHVFSVRDNGVGINLKDCESIFELFQRNPTSRGTEGSGLGLAIVKELAIKHGGNVWAKPNESGGAAFYFTLARDL